MTNVTDLRPHSHNAPDRPCVPLLHGSPATAFDPEPAKRLYRRMPLHEAEDTLCDFLEDIARRLEQLQRAMAARQLSDMARPARRVALAARQIGLLEVADSAQHLRTCLTLNDGVALHAVLARLERAFDVAVNEVWNLREM